MQITAPTAEPTPVTCLRGRTATRCKAAAADERALRDAVLLRDESCGLPGTQLASASSTVWRDPGATSPACRTGLRRLAILANASIANAAPEIAEGAASAFLSSAMLHRNASMRLIASGAPPSFGTICVGDALSDARVIAKYGVDGLPGPNFHRLERVSFAWRT
jgi:hypothetical protein